MANIDVSISKGAEVEEGYNNWESVFEHFADEYTSSSGKTNPAILVPANNLQDPESVDIFSRSTRSFKLGSSRVYRDDKDQCSIQVRVFHAGTPIPSTEEVTYDRDMYYVQLNWHNPNDSVGALKHLLIDVLKINIPQLRGCE